MVHAAACHCQAIPCEVCGANARVVSLVNRQSHLLGAQQLLRDGDRAKGIRGGAAACEWVCRASQRFTRLPHILGFKWASA